MEFIPRLLSDYPKQDSHTYSTFLEEWKGHNYVLPDRKLVHTLYYNVLEAASWYHQYGGGAGGMWYQCWLFNYTQWKKAGMPV